MKVRISPSGQYVDVPVASPTLADVLATGNSANGATITNLPAPIDPQDAANAAYVNAQVAAGKPTAIFSLTCDTAGSAFARIEDLLDVYASGFSTSDYPNSDDVARCLVLPVPGLYIVNYTVRFMVDQQGSYNFARYGVWGAAVDGGDLHGSFYAQVLPAGGSGPYGGGMSTMMVVPEDAHGILFNASIITTPPDSTLTELNGVGSVTYVGPLP